MTQPMTQLTHYTPRSPLTRLLAPFVASAVSAKCQHARSR
jgi:hypothetical protein